MANTVFSQSTPAGSDNRSDGDDRIRELKTALRSALDAGKYVPADLVVKNNAATPASKVDVTASGLIVSDGSAVAFMLDAVSVTADIAVAGANGLDTGVEAANTWYFIWVIYNSTTNTIAALLSLSATAPTMPAGYAYKRRVGAVRNNATSNFPKFIQRGRRVLYEAIIDDIGRALTDGVATVFTDVVLTTFLPATAQRALLSLVLDYTHNAVAMFVASLRTNGSTAANGIEGVRGATQVASVREAVSDHLEIDTDSGQIVEYKLNTAPATAGGLSVIVDGYEDPI